MYFQFDVEEVRHITIGTAEKPMSYTETISPQTTHVVELQNSLFSLGPLDIWELVVQPDEISMRLNPQIKDLALALTEVPVWVNGIKKTETDFKENPRVPIQPGSKIRINTYTDQNEERTVINQTVYTMPSAAELKQVYRGKYKPR